MENNEKEQEKIGRENCSRDSAKISEVGKGFVESSEGELSQIEAILKSPEADEKAKKQLVDTLKHVDEKIMKPTTGGSSNKETNLKENVKENVKAPLQGMLLDDNGKDTISKNENQMERNR